MIKHYTDLLVWQRSHKLFLDIVEDVDIFPNKRAANTIADQIIRSSGSISANIAEGFNRSKAKFLNSLDIALGEANETENWLYKIRDLKYNDIIIAEKQIEETKIICRMLNSLIAKIKSRKTNP
jgi:four helix bundle protein